MVSLMRLITDMMPILSARHITTQCNLTTKAILQRLTKSNSTNVLQKQDVYHFLEILYKHVMQNLSQDKMKYLILDEIQIVENFQKVIDSLFLLDNVDIYVTGSNAYMLSGEIATLITGR